MNHILTASLLAFSIAHSRASKLHPCPNRRQPGSAEPSRLSRRSSSKIVFAAADAVDPRRETCNPQGRPRIFKFAQQFDLKFLLEA